MHEAIALAVQVDHKFSECQNTNSRVALVSKPLVPPVATIFPNRPRFGTFFYQKLTQEEIQRKKDHWECWFCDDKWVRGHKCPHKQLLMLDVIDLDDLELLKENGGDKDELPYSCSTWS